MKIVDIKKSLLLFIPFVGSAVMLTLIQPPFDISLLAWVSLVPFLFACSSKIKTRTLVIISYLVAVGYWLCNLYWMLPVTCAGWLVLCMYMAVLWPVVIIAIRYCMTKKIPLFLAVPILIVGAERLQGLFLGGFYWRFLAHSQYGNITLIQIADIFGAAGLSFLIAMTNAVIAELIIAVFRKNVVKVHLALKAGLVCVLLGGTIFYGTYRIRQSESTVSYGPLVGSVQSNVPQTIKTTPDASIQIFEDLLESSKAAAKANAELIVWPETMVQAIMNEDVWRFLADSENNINFDKALKEHSKDTAFVLIGAPGGEFKQRDDSEIYLARYNTAFLYEPQGRQSKIKYNKIHLVPFGEVIPCKYSIPWLHKFFMFFTPYDYDYSLEYGTEYTAFEMTSDDEKEIYKFGVMICYEDAIPLIARKFALDQQGRKRIDWLVNISNDGWFVKLNDGNVTASTELRQHAAICVFRAVENRLGVLRSVNTGISCLIDSVGRVKDGFFDGSLPYNARERQAVAGWFVDEMPIDTRVTFFSQHGQWLDIGCAICLVLVIISQILGNFVRFLKKKRANK